MKYVGPVASGLGISLETTTAALMKLYNTGYGGEQAGTYLKQAFQKLASGTQDLKTKLQELGISYEEVNPQTRNFADIINTLKGKNIGVTESIAIFGETAGGAMAKLIEEGGDAIATMEGLLKSSEGAAAEMQNIQNASFANTKAELSSAMEAVQITIGSILEPAMNGLLSGVTELLKGFNSLPVGIQTFITTMATASTAIVPFLTMPALIGKIKDAMKMLNTTMLHNPIFIAGAVVTAVASIAYSVYSQVKKSREDMVKEATKGVEDIKEMQRKAQEAGDKGRNIQNLLRQYETLKDKTNKTKEEQEKYNQTLKNLTNLVPDVVTEINETGEAYIKNIEKIKLASKEQLLLEQKQIELKETMMSKRAIFANATIAYADEEIEKTNIKLDKYAQKAREASLKIEGYRLMKEQGEEALAEWLKNITIDGQGVHKVKGGLVHSSLEQDKEMFFRLLGDFQKEFQPLLDEKDRLEKLKDDAQKTLDELNELTNMKNVITEKLTETEAIPTTSSPPTDATKKQVENNQKTRKITLASELQYTDEFYNEMLALAKEYGKNENEIVEEYKNKRLEILEKYKKKEGESASVYKKDDAVDFENPTGKEKAKQSITIKEEIEKTSKMGVEEVLSFLDKLKKEQDAKQKELTEVLTNIKSLQDELAKLNAIEEKSEKDVQTVGVYQNALDSLQQKAQSLSNELGQDYVLLGDIDAKIAELDKQDTNSFTSKFKAIQNVKKATIKAIGEAQAAGNIDEKTAEEKIKKINAVALKATVTVEAELTKTILSVGNNVTDIILGAIAKGEISLEDAFYLVSQIGGQIADMIPDPMTKAIIGAAQMGVTLISKFVNYIDNKANKFNAERAKAREDEEKRSQDEANRRAGDTASRIAKQTNAVKQGFINYDKMMNDMSVRLQQNQINDVLQKLGEKKSLASETRWDTRIIEEGWFFGLGKKVAVGWERYHYEYQFTMNELAKKIQEAHKKGDTQLENKLKNLYKKSIEKNLKAAGINTEELNGFHNYLQGLENVFVDAVRNKDFARLRDAMKEKIREAMWAKLQESIILSRLKPLFMELEKAGFQEKEKVIDKIMKEGEDIAKELENYSQKVFGELGGVPTELEQHRKAWRGLKDSIAEALSSSLGEAAYNADWASFKKAFASEMKKAIISSTVANAGFKTKIDNIIKDIMKDGKITADEVNNSIDELQSYFDQLEGKLEPLAKITKALEGGVDVKSEHAGTIIQQLSGADRDFFAEEFRKNFTTMGDSFKSAMIDLKEIHQAKIIVEMATLTVHDIYINAGSVTDLKTLIAEMIEEARRAG